MNSLKTFIRLMNDFVKAQKKYADCGAWDTEPSYHFRYGVANILRGNPWKGLTPDEWELYTECSKRKLAARALNTRMRRIERFVLDHPMINAEKLIDIVDQNF